MKKVTIIVPVYNAENKIGKLINSLAAQTNQDFEVIFVDDASKDDSVSVIKKECNEKFIDYKIITLKTNHGPGNARNIGIRDVKSTYCMFVDADDWVSDNYVAEMLKAVVNNDSDIAFSSGVKIWADGREKEHYKTDLYAKYLNNQEALINIMDYGPWGKIFNRNLWDDDCKFPEGIRCEDLASIPVLISKTKKYSISEEAKYYYLMTENSRSRNNGEGYDDIFQSCVLLDKRIPSAFNIEFLFVTSVMYGTLMNAILHGEKNKVLDKYVNYIRKEYADGMKNRLLRTLPFPKQLFIFFAYKKWYMLLRAMVKLAK